MRAKNILVLGVLFTWGYGCEDGCEGSSPPETLVDAGPPPANSMITLDPDAGDAPKTPPPPAIGTCPDEMVRVDKRYCVDRYESHLVDASTEALVSPYYSPTASKAVYVEKLWQRLRVTEGNARAREMPLPPLPGCQTRTTLATRAVSRQGVVPQAYASMIEAASACQNAGKRLCTADEWIVACRGESNRDFPYGDEYAAGQCNIFREGHPGVELHDNPSINHSDPRFNLVTIKGQPLLRRTGDTATCASRWEDDAIYDMVGNVDEWVDDPDGRFLGGFFSRAKKDGCASSVSAHGPDYADYSTGVRCCRDLIAPEPPGPPEPR